jgi:hypothetical protein
MTTIATPQQRVLEIVSDEIDAQPVLQWTNQTVKFFVSLGNRQAKGTHIGEQKGPTWVQGFTTKSGLPCLLLGRCSCSG